MRFFGDCKGYGPLIPLRSVRAPSQADDGGEADAAMTELVPVRYHEAARALACPSCGAKSGERGRTAAGQQRRGLHGGVCSQRYR